MHYKSYDLNLEYINTQWTITNHPAGWNRTVGKRNDVGETEGRYCEGTNRKEKYKGRVPTARRMEKDIQSTSSSGYETISDCEGTQYRCRICLPIQINQTPPRNESRSAHSNKYSLSRGLGKVPAPSKN